MYIVKWSIPLIHHACLFWLLCFFCFCATLFFSVLMLTPSDQRQLDHVISDVNVEDSDEKKVEVQGFNSHPGERTQQAVVYRHSNKHTHFFHCQCSGPLVEHEAHVEKKQSAAQRHVNAAGHFCSCVTIQKHTLCESKHKFCMHSYENRRNGTCWKWMTRPWWQKKMQRYRSLHSWCTTRSPIAFRILSPSWSIHS